jgi:hypothetical protein
MRIGMVALFAGYLLLVGCSSNSTSATSPGPKPTPTPTQIPRTLMFKLNGMSLVGGSEVYSAHGTVQVDVKIYGYTLTVTAQGLTPDSRHRINMHAGSCAAPVISLMWNTAYATADANGNVTSVEPWTDVYYIPPEGRILTVHGDDQDNPTTHIACADLTN